MPILPEQKGPVMAEYALSTNLYTFAQAEQGFFGWPADSGEAEVIRAMQPGDTIVPKFARVPTWDPTDEGLEAQRQYCAAIGADFDKMRELYEAETDVGSKGVPYLLRVKARLPDDDRSAGVPWTCVSVEKVPLTHPLSSHEFLLLRALPVTIAAQFKGAVAPGRHLQELPPGTVAAIQAAASDSDRAAHLRQYSVVEATTPEGALERLLAAGRALHPGDRVFIAGPASMLGVFDVVAGPALEPASPPIGKTPDELLDLLEEAKARVLPQDQFSPSRAVLAARELKGLLEGPNKVIAIEDFGRFHDRYALLASKVTQALEIAQRPVTAVPTPGPTAETDDAPVEEDELSSLQGLTISAVRKALPDDMVLSDEVLAEAVTALRAGKHLLLGGPPGTGKSTLAEALCQAVVGAQYEVATATADWTTFDTIGGYIPSPAGLEFEPGIVLRALKRGRWLTIDELNRADIDKAFGPLFTLLAGSGGGPSARRVVLPFQKAGQQIEIHWAERRTGATSDYVLTPGWRLIGTLNLSDKATLFQLSFAFLRRFAVLDVPLPDRKGYRTYFDGLCTEVDELERKAIVDVAMELAFSTRQLGPAILKDVALFLTKGLAETATGEPTYDDPVAAFITAVRLFAVPQYEGATSAETAAAMQIVKAAWPDRGDAFWAPLDQALRSVALS